MPSDLTMELDQVRVEEAIVESTDIEMHLSMKLRGILRPKSVRTTLVTGLIYGPRANEQFDIVF